MLKRCRPSARQIFLLQKLSHACKCGTDANLSGLHSALRLILHSKDVPTQTGPLLEGFGKTSFASHANGEACGPAPSSRSSAQGTYSIHGIMVFLATLRAVETFSPVSAKIRVLWMNIYRLTYVDLVPLHWQRAFWYPLSAGNFFFSRLFRSTRSWYLHGTLSTV